MKTLSLSVATFTLLGLSVIADETSSNFLQINGSAASFPALTLSFNDELNPQTQLVSGSLYLWNENGVTLFDSYVPGTGVASWRWISDARTEMKLDTSGGGLTIGDAASGKTVTIYGHASGSIVFRDGAGNQSELKLVSAAPSSGSVGLLINNQQVLTEGSSIPSGWSSSIISQSAADARYLRVNQSRLQYGAGSVASTDYSVALGWQTNAIGQGATAIGAGDPQDLGPYNWNVANGKGATAIGYGVNATSDFSIAMGSRSQALGQKSIVLGFGNTATSEAGVAIGLGNYSNNMAAVAIGNANHAAGDCSMAMGLGSYASGNTALAFGYQAQATGYTAVAIGSAAVASHNVSVSIGWGTNASGSVSTALGALTTASGGASFASGSETLASGTHSTAMGRLTKATQWGSTALGEGSEANGVGSVAFGRANKANGHDSLAVGYWNQANGFNSAALGQRTIALGANQLVIGRYNIEIADVNEAVHNPSDAVFIIGNGTEPAWDTPGSAVRSNAFVVRWNGDTEASGTVTSTASGPEKYNKFKAPILVPPSGDISMGEFTAGEQP